MFLTIIFDINKLDCIICVQCKFLPVWSLLYVNAFLLIGHNLKQNKKKSIFNGQFVYCKRL